MNSCVNPFIYAQTIPAFKELVRGYILTPRQDVPQQNTTEETMKMTMGACMQNETDEGT